jgi:hypothetical protein
MAKKNKEVPTNSIYYTPDHKELRARGYMTIDEFVEKLTPGMRDYMHKNWGFTNLDDLHHPADLASTASIYTDGLYNFIETFGIQPYNREGF